MDTYKNSIQHLLKNTNTSKTSTYYDLSIFLLKETIIVSDLEGVAPTKQIDSIMKSGKQVLYLGDLCDYTYPDELKDTVKPENLCMLRLMKHFVAKQDSEHGATRWILGNRDLNKIKLRHLLRLSDNSTYWKHRLNKPNKEKHCEQILNLAVELVNNNIQNNIQTPIDKTNEEFVEGENSIPNETRNNFMSLNSYLNNADKEKANKAYWAVNGNDFKAFAPYWNTSIKSYKDKWNNKYKTIRTYTLKQRFDIIFGADPAIGTMSAQNTLYELPREYGITDEMIDEIKKQKNVSDDELRSALVFIIYMRLLDKSLYKAGNGGEFDGYLYQYLSNGSCVNYAKHNNDLYLFSHAGMKLNFFMNSNTSLEYLSKITKDQWSKDIIQSGGVHDYSYKSKIVHFNSQVINLIKYILEFDYKTNVDIYTHIQVLGAIAVPAYKNKKLNELLNPVGVLAGLSPVSLLISDNQDKADLSWLNPSGNVINVFGHITYGLGYTFNKVADKSFVITTDFSNYFMKSKSLKMYNDNKLLLSLNFNSDSQDKIFYLYGNIYYDADKFKNFEKYKSLSGKEKKNAINGNMYLNYSDYLMDNYSFLYRYRFDLSDFPTPTNKYERYSGKICLILGSESSTNSQYKFTNKTSELGSNSNTEFGFNKEFEFNNNNQCEPYVKLYSESDFHGGISNILLYLESDVNTIPSGGFRKTRKTRKTRKHRKVRTIRRNRK